MANAPTQKKVKTLSKDQNLYSQQIQKDILMYMFHQFDNINLSKEFKYWTMSKMAHIIPNELVINPKAYDTAWYIKTSRSTRKGMGAKSVGEKRYKGGSYALDLNNKGSEFDVFRKKANLPPHLRNKTIANLGVNNLERVKIYPHNHKALISNAVVYACNKFAIQNKSLVEKIEIFVPQKL